jgi:uncharacterized protein (DUF885 family)
MTGPTAAHQDLHQLFADYWEFRLREDPLSATIFYGDHRFDDALPRVSEADYRRRQGDLQGFQQRLFTIETALLSSEDATNYAIFALLLSNEIAEIGFRAYLMPVSRSSSFTDVFADLPHLVSLATVPDYEHYIARIAGFADYAHAHIELMRIGIRDGYLPPRATLVGVDAALRMQATDDPTASPLWQPFEHFPAGFAPEDRDRLAGAGRTAIEESLLPGYRALLAFLHEEYLPAARDAIAASSLPDGAAFYRHRIRMLTTLDLPPESIHETGLAEVGRIRAEMEAVIRKTGFTGSFAEFVTFLRTDDRFYVATPEALLKEVAYVLKRMDGELPTLFQTLPRTPYGIRPVPADSAPNTTTAYYMPPAGDGGRAGFYYVNTYDLRSRPLYEVEALSLHEAVPGHHLQIALQQELGDVPAFRRFEFFTAYVEGWGLYAERLGLEVGFYQDPYSDFGRLSYEMWRACRLVVDTGMHALGWTRQQAIDFMAEHTALTLLNIENEVDRYIAWPGQALAYKLGELTIRRLRAEAEQSLGSHFDLRAFHDIVLRSGPVPLEVLQTNVRAWIAQQYSALHSGTLE